MPVVETRLGYDQAHIVQGDLLRCQNGLGQGSTQAVIPVFERMDTFEVEVAQRKPEIQPDSASDCQSF